jgi:hypothetical protein
MTEIMLRTVENMGRCRAPHRNQELHVYFAYFPEHGPEQRLYDDHDIQRAGGIERLELEIRRQSYSFIYLGVVEGRDNGAGIEIASEDFAALPEPVAENWRIGERDPSYGLGEAEHQIFNAIFKALAGRLESWAYQEDGAEYRYSVKKLDIDGYQLSRSAAALAANGDRENLVVTFCAVQHWHPAKEHWRTIYGVTEDSNLVPIRLRVPLQLKREGEQISAEVTGDMRSW